MSILENPIPNEVFDNATSPLTDDRAAYKDSTYEIVSKVAYLIGVPKRIIANEHEAPKVEVYNRLDSDKTARIIRHLCIVRTAIERNFKRINERMRFQYETILSMPEYVPQESINQLSLDGVIFIKNTSKKLCQHVVEINRLICDRINNCKKLFPLWINWDYIKALFVMPDGLKEDGTREAADIYYSHLLFYPYQMYINWQPEEVGNILYNDKKFVTLLYSWNNDYFTEYSKVSDAGSYIRNNSVPFTKEISQLYYHSTSKMIYSLAIRLLNGSVRAIMLLAITGGQNQCSILTRRNLAHLSPHFAKKKESLKKSCQNNSVYLIRL